MRIGLSTGYREEYWTGWPWAKMYGGSEHIVVELAAALAAQDHSVTVRLPRPLAEVAWRGVRWIGGDHPAERFDLLFCFDDFARSDNADRTALVACRSDPPPHTQFDSTIFLSRTHAELMGHPGAPCVGGGVNLAEYGSANRLPRRVICTSSPDRCAAAAAIGAEFDFVHSYRPVPGMPPTVELDRAGLIDLQRTARCLIYPLDPVRPSDFFSMSVVESLAAGTPVIVSDADSMKELWQDAAIVLPLPIRLGEWSETVEDLLSNKARWKRQSQLGMRKAAEFDWPIVAQKYLKAAE